MWSAVKATDMPVSFSVVIPACDQLAALQHCLPAVLAQDYYDMEVIVVDVASTDGTAEYLEQMEVRDQRLHHTAVPASARDISVERLALALGCRAARFDWVVITHADCEPVSAQWLSSLAEAIAAKPDADLVLGYSRYQPAPKSWLHYREDYYRLWHTLAMQSHMRSGHAAVRADGANVAFRREALFAQGGFSAGQTLLSGAEVLMANSISTPQNTVVASGIGAAVLEQRPASGRLWRQQRLFYAETRRHQQHATWYRIRQFLRMVAPWLVVLFVLLPLAALIVLLCNMDSLPQVLTDRMAMFDAAHGEGTSYQVIVVATAVLALLALTYYSVRLFCFNRAAHRLGWHSFYFTLPVFDLALPFWQFATAMRHLFTPKSTFRKRFV